MTESELIVGLSEVGANVATYFTAYFSFTFAYLTVAYMAGSELSRFQCLLISALYLFVASVFGAVGVGYSEAWMRLYQHKATIISDIWTFDQIGWIKTVIAMLVAASLASLYFMYDVRRKSNKSSQC